MSEMITTMPMALVVRLAAVGGHDAPAIIMLIRAVIAGTIAAAAPMAVPTAAPMAVAIPPVLAAPCQPSLSSQNQTQRRMVTNHRKANQRPKTPRRKTIASWPEMSRHSSRRAKNRSSLGWDTIST